MVIPVTTLINTCKATAMVKYYNVTEWYIHSGIVGENYKLLFTTKIKNKKQKKPHP